MHIIRYKSHSYKYVPVEGSYKYGSMKNWDFFYQLSFSRRTVLHKIIYILNYLISNVWKKIRCTGGFEGMGF